MTSREPLLNPVKISELRPTQMTVGFREVALKRKGWRERRAEAAGQYLGRHMIPAAIGPHGEPYVIDHHHLCLALHEEGVEEVLVQPVANLSHLRRREFWTFLDCHGWCHAYDAAGRRRGLRHMPERIDQLADDPYRSLAGELRRVGGYAKETTPFTEFIWADFLRRRVPAKLMDDDFPVALEHALKLARSSAAEHLPGWCGPSPRTD